MKEKCKPFAGSLTLVCTPTTKMMKGQATLESLQVLINGHSWFIVTLHLAARWQFQYTIIIGTLKQSNVCHIGVCRDNGRVLYSRMNFLGTLHVRIFEPEVSIQQYCNNTILTTMCSEFRVTHTCITELIHMQTPVQI